MNLANFSKDSRTARALVAGFSATTAATFLLFLSHLAVMLLARLEPNSIYSNMADNPLVNGASGAIYLAVTLHFVMGLFLALIYAHLWRPRVRGSAAVRGMTFALFPWFLSCTVLFPFFGLGAFALGLGAGILPAAGSLLLHLVYGFTLSLAYQPSAYNLSRRTSRTEFEEDLHAVRQAKGGALGLLTGATVGSCIGLAGIFTFGLGGLQMAGMPGSWLLLALLFGCCSMGLLVGLLAGAPRTA